MITRLIKSSVFIFILLGLFSCTPKENEADKMLKNARELYEKNEYQLAKNEIDSLKTQHPKAFEQIKAALALLDSVRRGENIAIIADCDSLIPSNEKLLNELKKQFVYVRNKEYQDKGTYIPKGMMNAGEKTITLRSGVAEEGGIFLESIFVGNQRHTKIKATTDDGLSAETLPVRDDGFNYRFKNLGVDHEIMKFMGVYENNISQFINQNDKKAIKITLEGNQSYSYQLPQQAKQGISQSFRLAELMKVTDSLKTEREKAEFKIYYLDNNKNNSEKIAGENELISTK